MSQLSEQRAAPGVTIKYFSSLRDGANAGDEQLPGAVPSGWSTRVAGSIAVLRDVGQDRADL